MGKFCGAWTICLLFCTGFTSAQSVVVYRPGMTVLPATPIVVGRPVVAAPVAVAPVVVARPVAPPVVYPAPVIVRRPVAVVPPPPAVVVPAPVVTYSPIVTVPPPPAVVVRPKVYVSGQPVRNVLRAITP